MENTKMRNKNLNIPNALSAFRIIIIPFFIYFFLNDEIITAGILIILSGISDAFDGMVARKFNQITELGKLLDPFADKLTQIVIAICLGIKFPMLFLFLSVFLLKEFAMLILASLLVKSKKKPSAAMWYGKVSTILFYLSATVIIIMYELHVERQTFYSVSVTLLFFTVIMMIYSAVKYYDIYKNIKASDSKQHRFHLKRELSAKKVVKFDKKKRNDSHMEQT